MKKVWDYTVFGVMHRPVRVCREDVRGYCIIHYDRHTDESVF